MPGKQLVMADLGGVGLAYATRTQQGIVCVLSPRVLTDARSRIAARAVMTEIGAPCGTHDGCGDCPLGGA